VAVLAVLEDTTLPRQAALTLKVQDPVVDENSLDALGIKEIIGRGETSFAGSPANRIHNIKTGLSFLQSALLKPGEEFSTVKKLGAVDNTTGYLPELVIKENRTTPEYGGGLCQVSTTLFRAVLKAGLKVTERQNHSYRVSYYEPPVGLDATIYLPRPDFKFLNDTPGHILVQGQVIGNRIIFELWGTSDGRTSVVTDPIITNIKPPPPEIRTETDTLPLGEVKQIEKPHEGATAIAYYTVTRNGQVINKQTFKSIYKPWAARFLVGTRVDNPPPPEG
jgi:vancomycin resistance protein YoaR